MTAELAQAVETILDRLKPRIAEDAELRRSLRTLAQSLLALTEEEVTSEQETAAAPAVPTPPPPPDGEREREPETLPPITLNTDLKGAAPAPPSEEPTAAPEPAATWEEDLPDLHLVAQRCRLKAEGARWAADRHRRLRQGADFAIAIEPVDRDIIERAKQLPDCFLWMNSPWAPEPTDLSQWENLAYCFETLVAAIALVHAAEDEANQHPDLFEKSLYLLAEVQSALRVAVERLGARPDFDQNQTFRWLRNATQKYHVYIDRHMRLDDPADPDAIADLDERIEALDAQIQSSQQRGKRRQQLIRRIRYHLPALTSGDGTDHTHDWHKIIESVDELVTMGTPPSDIEIRELLAPVIDELPEDEDLPPGFQRVLREIDRALASREVPARPEASTLPTPEVQAVARWLKNKVVVIIGGYRRPHAQQALQDTLGLKALDWIETREHQSTDTFEPHIARPDVALVLLAIRWSSHAFGNVKQFCDQYGKPLVRLPAGYAPNQVARQIVEQVSDQLQKSADGTPY